MTSYNHLSLHLNVNEWMEAVLTCIAVEGEGSRKLSNSSWNNFLSKRHGRFDV